MPRTRDTGYISAYPVIAAYTEAVYGEATGGTSSSITVGGINYTLLTFTSDSNLVVSKAGLFDVCAVGGGGSGGSSRWSANLAVGGGGAGGVAVGTIYLAAATHTIDIGAGGAGGLDSRGGDVGFATKNCCFTLLDSPGIM